MYENMLGGSSEYVMGGVMVTQGITDYLILGIGWETRFNFSESYYAIVVFSFLSCKLTISSPYCG